VTFPVVAEDPTGRTVEVNDPTREPTSSDPVVALLQGMRDGLYSATQAAGLDLVQPAPERDYSRYAEFCRLKAEAESLRASADRLDALAALIQPEAERREASAAHYERMAESGRENAAAYRRMGERHARMAED
jgi:hypothetical protein